MSKVNRISQHSYALTLDDGRVYTLSSGRYGGLDSLVWSVGGHNWELMPQVVGGYRVVPYGSDNRLPVRLRDIIGDNNLVPGILERQMGLLYGQGLFLGQRSFEDGKIVHRWVDDPEVWSWLHDWDYESYVKGCMTDYLHLKGFFDLKRRARGYRIGRQARIACLEHVPAKDARLEWVDSRRLADVRHIVVSDFEAMDSMTGIRVYPVFDPRDPGRYAVSASYNHTCSFSRDFYSVPSYWGALKWIVRGSEIPTIFKYVTDNGINLAYHIQSPPEYWDEKRDVLRRLHPDWDDIRVEEAISDLTGKLLQSMTEVLSGKENAGKFIHTSYVMSPNGERLEWKIEAIDQKIRDFVESQLKISEASVSAITSGMGLHPSLSNVMVNGKLASGSELLYAFKLYLLSDVEIASRTILEPLNQAIEFNFPGRNLRLAFYHQPLQSEEALTSSERIKNQ